MLNNNINTKQSKLNICSHCNPKKFLKFNFSFAKDYGTPTNEDILHFFERIKKFSSKPYEILIYENQGNKKQFLEEIKCSEMKWKKGEKQIPTEFREFFPSETNEKFAIFRVYPAGKPNGTANPRIIGMIKHTIFYIFYFDWNGEIYEH